MQLPMRNNVSWEFPETVDVPQDFYRFVGGDPLVAQILYHRGCTTIDQAAAFLNPEKYQPTPGSELPDLENAVSRLKIAVKNEESILVWGDFDVDGQTSTTLLVSALQEAGCTAVPYIPHRLTESHGLNPDRLKILIQKNRPDIVLTCDTGIDAFDSARLCAELGVDLIITDHHQLSNQIPDAFAVINPNMLPDTHSLHSLPGVGVAYKLIETLFEDLGLDSSVYLDLTALGIVADIAQLKGDTRYLLQLGLPILQDTPRLGLQALYRIADLPSGSITEEDIGFVIGPRLNALGRLKSALPAVEFLTTNDERRAVELAEYLESLNYERRQLTETIYESALTHIEQDPDLLENYSALVLKDPSWHSGVIGIVASRLVEKFNKPTILLTQDGDVARGSARSVKGVPISAMIAEQDKTLISHGGHPMAAGLSIQSKLLASFRRNLSASIDRHTGGQLPPKSIRIDAVINFSKISLKFIEDINRLAPFGPTNPPLLFASKNLSLIDHQEIGRYKEHRKLILKDDLGSTHDFLWWNSSELPIPSESFSVAYSLRISSFRGNASPQATIKTIKSTQTERLKPSQQLDLVEIFDFRQHPTPKQKLSEIIQIEPDLQIYGEGIGILPQPSKNRYDLKKGPALAVWTTPASNHVLSIISERVSPKRVYLFDQRPEPNTTLEFLETILGLFKYAAVNQEPISLFHLISKTAQTDPVVLAGLDYVRSHGSFHIQDTDNKFFVSQTDQTAFEPSRKLIDKLSRLIRETKSFRLNYSIAKKGNTLWP
jgi:single-stranded-DNA-specific exonuclease